MAAPAKIIFLVLLAADIAHLSNAHNICTLHATWKEANRCCSSLGLELPAPSNMTDMLHLSHETRNHNASSVWLSFTRSVRREWTWIDGDIAGPDEIDEARPGFCGAYNQSTRRVEARECDDKSVVGAICEIKNCEPCETLTGVSIVCIKYNNTCYIYFCNKHSWYQAKKNCLRPGWSMATVKRPELRDVLASRQWGCDIFWVGVRQVDWLYPENKGFIPEVYNIWPHEGRLGSGRCTVLNASNPEPLVHPVSCTSRHSALCVDNYAGHKQRIDKQRAPLFLVGMMVGLALFVIVFIAAVIVFIHCHKRRQKKHKEAIAAVLQPRDAEKGLGSETLPLCEDKGETDLSEQVAYPHTEPAKLVGQSQSEVFAREDTERGTDMGYKRDFGVPMKVIRFNQSSNPKFILDTDNLRRIVQDIEDVPVVLLSIAGEFRTGKSFLLNYVMKYLIGMENGTVANWLEGSDTSLKGFNWGPGCEIVTIGINMWSKPFYMKLSDGSRVAVLLMDTPGLFDDHSAPGDAAATFALSTMLSSIQVYNVMRYIGEHHLKNLELFVETGRMVIEDSLEKREGNESKPFQRLIYLVRDWSDRMKFEFGEDGGSRYLEQKLKGGEHVSTVLKSIRENVHDCFEQVECFLMPHPGLRACEIYKESDDEYEEMLFSGKTSEVTSTFKKLLSKVAPFLLSPEKIHLKKYAGKALTGRDLIQRFVTYLAVFQSDSLPKPTSTREALLNEYNHMIVTRARDIFEKKINELQSATPHNTQAATYRDCLETEKHNALEFFEKESRGRPEDVISHKETFEKDLNKTLELKVTEWAKQLLEQKTRLVSKFAEQYSRKMDAILLLHTYPPEEFEKQHKELFDSTCADLQAMMPNEAWQSELNEAIFEKYQEAVKKNQEKNDQLDDGKRRRAFLKEAVTKIEERLEKHFGEDTDYAPTEDIKTFVSHLKEDLTKWFSKQVPNAPAYYLNEIGRTCKLALEEYSYKNLKKTRGGAQGSEANSILMMTKDHLERITEMTTTLVKNLDLSPIFYEQVISQKVLPQNCVRKLQASNMTTAEIIQNLLFMLKKRPDTAFEGFLKALKNSDQAHLATGLL